MDKARPLIVLLRVVSHGRPSAAAAFAQTDRRGRPEGVASPVGRRLPEQGRQALNRLPQFAAAVGATRLFVAVCQMFRLISSLAQTGRETRGDDLPLSASAFITPGLSRLSHAPQARKPARDPGA